MNKELFKYFMARNRDNMKSVAEALGMHEITLYKKLNCDGNNELDRSEISTIAKRWGLSRDSFFEIFFRT